MTTLFIRHRVADYQQWRTVYDGMESTQKLLGVIGEEVYQSAGDPNDLTVTHDFASRESAEGFLASPELGDGMARAGVVGEPTIWVTERT